MNKLKFTILHFIFALLATATFAETSKTADQQPLINLSKPSHTGKAHLKRLYNIASPDDIKNANHEKAITAAEKIKSRAYFNAYTQADRANFYAYLGWLYLLTKHYELATQNYSKAIADYPVYSGMPKDTTIRQLMIASTQTDQAEKIFDSLYNSYIINLTVPDLVNIAELYSQQMQPKLSDKIYRLANKKSKLTDDYDRYNYYASLIKTLALHGNQDALTQLAIAYQEEGKNIPWKELLHWKNNNEHSYLPIERHAPVYPKATVKAGIEGYCDIEFSVDTNGRTINHKIVTDYPSGHFGEVSTNAAEKFKYRPFIGPDGQPIEKKNLINRFIYLL